MSDQVDRWLWEALFASEHGPRKPGTRLLLFIIRMHLWEGEGETFPGQERIAKFSGMSLRSVRNHLSDAAKLGWLEIDVTVGVRTVYRPKIPSTIVAAMVSGEIQIPHIKATTTRQNKRKNPANPAGVNEPTQANSAGVEPPSTPAKSARYPGKKRQGPRQNLHATPAESAADSYSDARYDTNKNTSGRALRATRTRIPESFDLSPQRKQYAIERGIDPVATFDIFRAYWISTGGLKADWDQTWRTWVLKDAKQRRDRSSPRRSSFEETQERLAARIAAADDDDGNDELAELLNGSTRT